MAPSMKVNAAHLLLLVLGNLPAGTFAACNTSDFTEAGKCAEDDETALIQQVLHVKHRHDRSPALQEEEELRQSLATNLVHRLLELGKFDCARYPSLCQAPFNCHEVDTADLRRWLQDGPAASGTPNYKLWCAIPHYQAYASRCAAGDLSGAGKIQFQMTNSGYFGQHVKELDGSYCFMEGHCANTNVTNTTTALEAVQMCDDRFGREAWSTWGSLSTPSEDQLGTHFPTDMSGGYTSQAQTRPTVLAACAMGNYHCDVLSCRETYCKEEYFVNKYGRLLKEYGWAA